MWNLQTIVILNCKFALYNILQIFRKNGWRDRLRGIFCSPFPRIHRSCRSVRRIMVSFSICISPTNPPISLVPPRFNNITHCCERGMHACKFATVFRQFRGYEPDALLPLLCRKIPTGYSAISIIDVNTLFFLMRHWFTRTRKNFHWQREKKSSTERFFNEFWRYMK